MDLWLVVREGAYEGRAFRIAVGDKKMVGRASECVIRLPDQAVSRRHCAVENIGGVLRVVDLDSANGSWINGQLVADASLGPGDQLAVGPVILECRAEPTSEGVRKSERADILLLRCPQCKETLYTTWHWVENVLGGYDYFCVCEHCGHRWLQQERSHAELDCPWDDCGKKIIVTTEELDHQKDVRCGHCERECEILLSPARGERPRLVYRLGKKES
jgi:DNA-directed RNA polymerase subunit RPC12/RpoP